MVIIINSVIDMLSNWGWDDFDKFVFVEVDFIVFWDDIEIKLWGFWLSIEKKGKKKKRLCELWYLLNF